MKLTKWLHAVVAVVLAITTSANALADGQKLTADDWTPRRLLESAKYIMENVDIEDTETVTRLLRIEMRPRERPLPGTDLELKSQQAEYLTKASYRIGPPLADEGGRKHATLELDIKHETFCVQLEDAHAVLGDRYVVGRPVIRHYRKPDGTPDHERTVRELRHPEGRYEHISYSNDVMRQGVSIVFQLRRCARIIGVGHSN